MVNYREILRCFLFVTFVMSSFMVLIKYISSILSRYPADNQVWTAFHS